MDSVEAIEGDRAARNAGSWIKKKLEVEDQLKGSEPEPADCCADRRAAGLTVT
jgi:hypothetical protein